MDFKNKLEGFIEKQKNKSNLRLSDMPYLETLVEDIIFKYNSILYSFNKIQEIKLDLEKLSKQQLDVIQKSTAPSKTTEQVLLELQNANKEGKISYSTGNTSLQISKSINSDKLFFEFESLLFAISSFIDYSFKIIKVFFRSITTRKSKILKSLEQNNVPKELKNFLKDEYSNWIIECLKYRDYVMHMAAINSNLTVRFLHEPAHGKIIKHENSNKIEIELASEIFENEVRPTYIPRILDYKHIILEKLNDGQINYEEDFYTFEEYYKKIQTCFLKYAETIFDKI